MDKMCPICFGIGWVCEFHPNRAWHEELGCMCGAGMPCECNRVDQEEDVQLLVSVRRVLESYESPVIQEWWPDSRRGHRCGRARTAPATTAASCDIRVI